MNPAAIWFQGLYLFRVRVKAQSVSEKMPPQSAKLPPMMGPLLAISFSPPINLSLRGARYIPAIISEPTFKEVEEDSSYASHGEGTAEVVDDSIGTRLLARSHNYFISLVMVHN